MTPPACVVDSSAGPLSPEGTAWAARDWDHVCSRHQQEVNTGQDSLSFHLLGRAGQGRAREPKTSGVAPGIHVTDPRESFSVSTHSFHVRESSAPTVLPAVALFRLRLT